MRARSLSSIWVPLNHLLGSSRRSLWPLTHLGSALCRARILCIAIASKPSVVPCSRWMAWSKARTWESVSLEGIVGRRRVMGRRIRRDRMEAVKKIGIETGRGSVNRVDRRRRWASRGQRRNRDQGQIEVLLSRSPTEERQVMRKRFAAAWRRL